MPMSIGNILHWNPFFHAMAGEAGIEPTLSVLETDTLTIKLHPPKRHQDLTPNRLLTGP